MSGTIAAIYWISVVLTGLVLIHALTRSQREWLAADRNKAYWVASLIIGMIFGPIGVVMAIVYLIAVIPRMTGSDRTPGPFDKR